MVLLPGRNKILTLQRKGGNHMETELTVDTTSPERNLGVSQSRREYRLVSHGVSQETNTSQQGLESLRSLMEEVFDR